MNIIRCSKGHFFDKDTFDECPHCRVIASRKETPSSYSYGDFSRNTGSLKQKQETGTPEEPVTGKMEYDRNLAEPAAGKMEYDRNLAESAAGKMEYGSNPEEPVTGKIEYKNNPEESAAGKTDDGTIPDGLVTGEMAAAIPKAPASEDSEHTFRIEALDLDSFVELTAGHSGKPAVDHRVSPGMADQELLFEELTDEEWKIESARFTEEKESGGKELEESGREDENLETAIEETSGDRIESDEIAAEELPVEAETPAAPVIGKAAQTVQDLQDLPVGWLVCVEGPEAGSVYILRYGKSSIGRSASMTISLPGDTSLSNMNHAFVEYDAGRKQFYALPGTSRGLCYVADQLVLTRMPVNNYEKISLGESELMLVQLCGDHFDWDLS